MNNPWEEQETGVYVTELSIATATTKENRAEVATRKGRVQSIALSWKAKFAKSSHTFNFEDGTLVDYIQHNAGMPKSTTHTRLPTGYVPIDIVFKDALERLAEEQPDISDSVRACTEIISTPGSRYGQTH